MPFGPALRGYTGRQLVLRGEALFILDGVGGLTFTPAATWDVSRRPLSRKLDIQGNHQRAYSINRPGTASKSRVLHLMYQRSSAQPWKGVGPLSDCQETHNLAMALETRLRQEVGRASGPGYPDS